MQANASTKPSLNKYRILISLAVLLPCFSGRLLASDHKVGEIWLDKCSRCHGDTGDGNTPLGKKLKVSNYHVKEVQAKFTDEYLHKIIDEGKIDGDKRVMPSFKDEFSDDEVNKLTAYIRKLAK